MFIITESNCTNCKILKQMLGEHALRVQFVDAKTNIDLCRELGIKTIPALVKRNKDGQHEVVFDLGKIVSEVENANG